MISLMKRVFKPLLSFHSLRSQLLSRSLFILAGLLLIIGLFQYMFMKQFIYENVAMSLRGQIVNIPDKMLENEIDRAIADDTENARVLFPSVSMAYIDTHGGFHPLRSIENNTPPLLDQKTYHEAIKKSKETLNYEIIKDESGEGTLILLEQIKTESGLNGIVQIGTSTAPHQQILLRQISIYFYLASAGILMGLFTFLPVLKRTLIPLYSIMGTMEQLGAGNLNERLPATSSPQEIQRLSSSFNGMLERLEASFAVEKEAKEQMRRFIADASHELRTPLTSIHGFLEVLRRGAIRNQEQLESALYSMHGESERMKKLVEDLLLLAKMDYQETLQLENTLLDSLIRDMETQLRLLGGQRSVILSLAPAASVRIDQDKMKQVILNLFQNAVQHTDPVNGSITIELKQEKEWICLSVQDNGQGIVEEHLPFLFERFYRIESSRSRKSGGAGLGLAITKSIIELHGGLIQVSSREGEMTRFEIHLPLSGQ
ncbi:ATP-binding protein [Neobacillus mesonae]|nr:ATP-binding protein [Neobacillus mesonae]